MASELPKCRRVSAALRHDGRNGERISREAAGKANAQAERDAAILMPTTNPTLIPKFQKVLGIDDLVEIPFRLHLL